MATSVTSFIVDTLVDVLDADTTLELVRVWVPTRPPTTATNTVVYPYVNSIAYESPYENGRMTVTGTAQCEIMCRQQVATDPQLTGSNTIAAGLIARKIHKLIYDCDPESIATNNDTVFSTRITGIVLDGHVGHFDNNDGKIQMGLAVTVHFIQTRI